MLVLPGSSACATARTQGVGEIWRSAHCIRKKAFIADLVHELYSDSVISIFTLFLDSAPIPEKRTITYKFDHTDDTCCWPLDLTVAEFFELQNAWKENGLPEDLFYPEEKTIQFLNPPGLSQRFLHLLGFTGGNYATYTPKQWKQEKANRVKS